MGSRRDLILALAKESNKELNSSRNDSFSPRPGPSTNEAFNIEKNLILRLNGYVDYNHTPVIFDFYNEYKSSFKDIQQNKISPSKLRQLLNLQPNTNSKSPVKIALICDETMPDSDEEPCRSPLEQTTYFEDSDDSVKDKDYIPEVLSSSQSDDENYTCKIRASQTSQTILPRSPSVSPPRRLLSVSLPPTHSSPVTPSLLATGLLLPRSRSASPQRCTEQSTSTVLLTTPALLPISSNTIPTTEIQKEIGLNKAGLPRKRQVFYESLTERKKKKRQTDIEKLELKPSCGEKCPKKCSYKFTLLDREIINKSYSILNKESQGIFIKGMVDSKEVKTRKVTQKETPKRSTTYAYHLKNPNDDRVEVCKTFFLSTLGYNAKNDCRVLNILKRNINDQKDKRGKYIRENKIDRDIIKRHVLKYNPAISHYRREHAPRRLYLPSDINMTEMYNEYCQSEPDSKVSLETYRYVIKKEMNISFTHLGNEECELCALFKEHNKDHIENQDQNCDTCKQYLTHKKNYDASRINYKLDAENSANESDTKYYSVDLQKVVMLPRMEQYKAAIFCSRIIAFNESFVPLGKSKNLPIAVLWNETVSGRSSQDILSAYRVFFLQNRDAEKIVLWADNCSAQNKNWALLSFLVNIINSNLITTKTIEIKYFEPGHTFMSADQFHHQIEKNLRNTKVYDFDDYVDRVKKVNSMKTIVKEMDFTDFYQYDECVSQHKIRNIAPRIYLKDITHVKAERGYLNLKFKKDQNTEIFQTLDFLQNKVLKHKLFPEPKTKTTPRGITEEKKKEIIEKLVPLMPENRRQFWFNMPTSDASNLLLED